MIRGLGIVIACILMATFWTPLGASALPGGTALRVAPAEGHPGGTLYLSGGGLPAHRRLAVMLICPGRSPVTGAPVTDGRGAFAAFPLVVSRLPTGHALECRAMARISAGASTVPAAAGGATAGSLCSCHLLAGQRHSREVAFADHRPDRDYWLAWRPSRHLAHLPQRDRDCTEGDARLEWNRHGATEGRPWFAKGGKGSHLGRGAPGTSDRDGDGAVHCYTGRSIGVLSNEGAVDCNQKATLKRRQGPRNTV